MSYIVFAVHTPPTNRGEPRRFAYGPYTTLAYAVEQQHLVDAELKDCGFPPHRTKTSIHILIQPTPRKEALSDDIALRLALRPRKSR